MNPAGSCKVSAQLNVSVCLLSPSSVNGVLIFSSPSGSEKLLKTK